jgi:phosphoserine phosphatase
LASGSPEFYVRALADYVGAQGYVATQLEYGEQERFTGRFLGGDCVAELKAEKVRALADSLSVDLSASYAYSDVANDIPLLGAVGTPVGVWPERRLHSYCLDSNWRVEYW